MSIRESFNEEFGYLCKKYFSNVKVEPYYTYSNIIMYINGIPYEYYRFANNMEVMIPSYDEDVLLAGDFEDIYILYANEPFDFTFRIVNKVDDIVKTRDYNYKNENGKITTSYAYNEIDDFNNDFRKLYEESELPFEQFIFRNYFENLKNTNEIISSSIINKGEVSNYVTEFTNFDDCLDEIMDANDNKKYKRVKGNRQVLMEMNEQLTLNKMKNETKKII